MNLTLNFTRRTFPLLFLLLLIIGKSTAQTGRFEQELSGDNWSLWLDHGAIWADDKVYLPPVDVKTLPMNSPTCGWDELHGKVSSLKVAVPGTVEEHYWGAIGGAVQDTGGDYVGVSWWSRKFDLDPALEGKRITLDFESVNLRAEIFVNGKLVGYDVVGNTPFEVDATNAVVFGKENQLDIRITDPVGNFSWNDNILMRWGDNYVPAVHGFGGITGKVILKATDAAVITDVYVQNQPDPKRVKVFATIENHTGSPLNGNLEVVIHEENNLNSVVWEKTTAVSLPEGSDTFDFSANVPKAKLWEIAKDESDNAQLYEASVKFISANKEIQDNTSQRFGFRWFDVGEKRNDKRFYLNGKRVFILSAMTRGFWPTNGIFPTPEMAKRDMETMFDLGLNMMLLHRAIGQPLVFDYADSKGLLTYEEPGGYRVTENRLDSIPGPDQQAIEWRREKLKRMVIRDRSFPSLIIYNLKNEAREPPNEEDRKDVAMVHELDPSRVVTYNSGWAADEYGIDKPDDPFELHALPFKPLQDGGWWDQHHWYAYSGYTDDMYRNPKFYLRGVINAPTIPLAKDSLYPLNKEKIIFYGEEGAFGTMVRLQKIKQELDTTSATGFREQEHIDWFRAYDQFLDESGFRKAFPDVDSLTMSLGHNLHYFHGRNIENVRLNNIADAYNMNGWASASTRTDVVDMYRNPTSDPSIISHYTQPLYIAVKLRNKVVPVGFTPTVDLYIINEKNLKGRHTLNLSLTDSTGSAIWSHSYRVNIKGGEEFGQLLVENVKLPTVNHKGYYTVRATLNASEMDVTGFDNIFAVNLKDHQNISNLSILENDDVVSGFLNSENIPHATFDPNSEETGTIVIGNSKVEDLDENLLQNIFRRVQRGAKLIVLENADKIAEQVNSLLKSKPKVYQGDGISEWGGSGRFFVGIHPLLKDLPQAQSMSWEYQSFYKGPEMGDKAYVAGLDLNFLSADLVVALGNQGSKKILSGLSRIPVGDGNVILSTLNFLPNLESSQLPTVVAKKLFLNILED